MTNQNRILNFLCEIEFDFFDCRQQEWVGEREKVGHVVIAVLHVAVSHNQVGLNIAFLRGGCGECVCVCWTSVWRWETTQGVSMHPSIHVSIHSCCNGQMPACH